MLGQKPFRQREGKVEADQQLGVIFFPGLKEVDDAVGAATVLQEHQIATGHLGHPGVARSRAQRTRPVDSYDTHAVEPTIGA